MSTLAGILLLAAGEVAGFFAIWFLLKARIRRYLELDELLAGVREEARSLVTELNATADRNVSLVEDRIASLRELLSEVDKRLGIARRELENREVEKEVYARLSQRRPIVPSSQPSTPAHERPHERPHERAQEPIPLTLGGSEGASEPIAMPEIRVAAEPVKALKNRRESAVDLHRKGFSAEIIAARLGATVAEIELLVEMEEHRPPADEGDAVGSRGT
jgi:hypothetical protein